MKLNGYHIQFLRQLTDTNVRFIVIGGQARTMYSPHTPKDLDIWVDISSPNQEPLHKALEMWLKRYSGHALIHIPSNIPEKKRIHFPQWDTCYLDNDHNLVEIKSDEGIDILTSFGNWRFDKILERCLTHELEDMRVYVLNKEDAEISKLFGAREC